MKYLDAKNIFTNFRKNLENTNGNQPKKTQSVFVF